MLGGYKVTKETIPQKLYETLVLFIRLGTAYIIQTKQKV